MKTCGCWNYTHLGHCIHTTDDAQPMKAHELGRFVCVPASTCLHTSIDVNDDGVWVRGDNGMFSSAHRDCYEARLEHAQAGPEHEKWCAGVGAHRKVNT